MSGELDNTDRLEEMLFLLGRETLVGDGLIDGRVDELANQTHVEEERITKEFYAFYRGARVRLFDQLTRANPPPIGTDTLEFQETQLELAQTILDRVLFICFCEDTGLLPPNVIRQALTSSSEGFVTITRWQQIRGLFEAVNEGNPALKINAYNGGLFAKKPELDSLVISDEALDDLLTLADYDFETDLNVNILGHIFEQSIADLEAIRAEIRGEAVDRSKSKRKKQGIFYTPEYITRFIVARTIGGWLDERYNELRAKHYPKGSRTSKARELALYSEYFEVLKTIKVVDPACGSGAFLVAAFDFLAVEYARVNRTLASLRGEEGQLGLFDLDKQILQKNLYGVDLNLESVEITKLSLWLKTAHADRPLNNLDGNIKCGNSIIAPLTSHANSEAREAYESLPEDTRPFDWRESFPEVFQRGGFDVVLGNPPYVRQEELSPYKPYLALNYAAYHGVADLYVYFYERGLQLLSPEGRMAYIVTNKWLRAGYGEPLRRFFTEQATFEEIIDFGHAPIFEDADTFPCIAVYRHRGEGNAEARVRVCPVPRDRDKELSLEQFVDEHAYPIPWTRYGAEAWSLEPPEVDCLMEKLRKRGIPLRDFTGVKPYRGVLTGFNEAFLIDNSTRMLLIREDPKSEDVIKPYLRGKDIKRWLPRWAGLWMIVLKSSGDHAWPWSDAGDDAELVFSQTYPSLYAHMKSHEERLRKRSDQGRHWWELRSCDYYDKFEAPKIIHTDITWRPQFAYVDAPVYLVNTAYVWPTEDRWLLAVVNSPIMWAYMWRNAQHGKDDALRMIYSFTETLPIAKPTEAVRSEAEKAVDELITYTRESTTGREELLEWLYHEFSVEKPGQKLEAFLDLTDAEFIAEVKKRRPKGALKLKPADTTALKKAHADYANPARARRVRTTELECRLSDLVNQAYGLTDAEVELMWKTAPPRMPI